MSSVNTRLSGATPPKVVVLGTGGTIAGRAESATDHLGYQAGVVGVAELVASLPSLACVALECEQVAQVDSKDMDQAVWRHLLQRVAAHLERPDVGALVITHGTDTLEETSYLLHRVLKPRKPVVLTCAMRPASAAAPDGPQNLSDAVAVAQHPGAQGVVVVCAGQVHAGADVNKVHTYRLDAFDSGDAGALGCVEEGRLRRFREWPNWATEAAQHAVCDSQSLQQLMQGNTWPRVELITSHADANGLLVEALLNQAAQRPDDAVRGLVVAGTGNGTLHSRLEAALLTAEACGIRVVRASRCGHGRVIDRPGARFAHSQGLTPVKARLALVLDLAGVSGPW